MTKKFEEFEKEMKKAAAEVAKENESCIAEMENLRDHYIPEIVQTAYYLSKTISPFIHSFDYCRIGDINGVIITATRCDIAIGNMQMTVKFNKEDTTVEFYEGCDWITKLSKQLDLLKAVSLYLSENTEAIMASALRQYKNVSSRAKADAEVMSVYHVAIDM